MDKDVKIMLVIFGIIAIIPLILMGNLIKNQKTMVKTLSNFNEDFYTNLETIESNCGSTFITTCNINSKDLCIFTRICNKENYCKHDYIPIEECLKNVRVT